MFQAVWCAESARASSSPRANTYEPWPLRANRQHGVTSSYNFVREVSPIPDLKLNASALDAARVRLAAASMPVLEPPTPGAEVLGSTVVGAALAEVEPVLLHARASLAIVMAATSHGLGDISDAFSAVDAQLAGGLP